MKKIRVLLVDDQSLFVKSLEIVLETLAEDVKVTGVAYDGKEAIEYLAHTDVDVVLMDIRMPRMDGVEAVKLIRQSKPDVKIIMLTTFDDDRHIREALEYGAAGYVLKNVEPSELISYIRAVANRSVVVSDDVLDTLLASGRKRTVRLDGGYASSASLSQREMEVAALLADGCTNSEIAERLFVAEQTVRNHISSIYSKTGVHSRTKLIKAIREQELK